MSSRELTEWAAWEREHGPLGPERGDWQAALVAHVIAGANGSKSKIGDFVPRWGGGRRQSDEDMLTVFRALGSRGGRDGHDS